jgi:hypothetical protein
VVEIDFRRDPVRVHREVGVYHRNLAGSGI